MAELSLVRVTNEPFTNVPPCPSAGTEHAPAFVTPETAATSIASATRVVALAGDTDKTPAPKAVTATSAIRLKIVLFDIFFLSLVEFEYFSISARGSFGSSNSVLPGTHV